MSVSTSNISSTATYFSGAVLARKGVGATVTINVSGTWLTGDQYAIELTDSLTSLQTLIGAGYASGVQPTFIQTFSNKVYALGGASVYCSGVASPTTWNDPNGLGNGFLQLSNNVATAEPLVSLASFQGYLAFFSRWNIQVYQTPSDLSSWAIVQILSNMGTFASNSVQAMGELDVVFLSDTGFRSLRPQVSTLNAYINDIGSPVDAFVVKSLLANTTLSNSQACSVVEPSTRNYWGYLNGVIYVLNDYPSNKIVGWSTYLPTDSNGNAFTIQQFVIFSGQVYALGINSTGATSIWQYGGPSNDTYDATVCTVVTPFMTEVKAPSFNKASKGFDVVINSEYPSALDANNLAYAKWHLYATMDMQNLGNDNLPAGWSAEPVYSGTKSTYDLNRITYNENGTHISVKLQTEGVGPATLSALTWHYNIADEK